MDAYPGQRYAAILQQVRGLIAIDWNVEAEREEAEHFGNDIGSRAPFPDTVAAMQVLGKDFKLIALSNIAHSLFAKTLAGPLKYETLHAIYIAEDIGFYKPDHRDF